MLAVAIVLIQGSLGLGTALGFAFALLIGATMIYCFWLLLTTAAFWIIRMDEIHELWHGIYDSGRWPVTIYPGWLRISLTYLVPIAFAVTVPAEVLTGRITIETLALATAFAIALVLDLALVVAVRTEALRGRVRLRPRTPRTHVVVSARTDQRALSTGARRDWELCWPSSDAGRCATEGTWPGIRDSQSLPPFVFPSPLGLDPYSGSAGEGAGAQHPDCVVLTSPADPRHADRVGCRSGRQVTRCGGQRGTGSRLAMCSSSWSSAFCIRPAASRRPNVAWTPVFAQPSSPRSSSSAAVVSSSARWTREQLVERGVRRTLPAIRLDPCPVRLVLRDQLAEPRVPDLVLDRDQVADDVGRWPLARRRRLGVRRHGRLPRADRERRPRGPEI